MSRTPIGRTPFTPERIAEALSVALSRRRFVAGSGAALSLGLAGAPAFAQSDSAKIIVGFPAGGTSDLTARRVAEGLRAAKYAANVLVDNKPGAAGQLGVIATRDSAPDGNTMLLTPASMLAIYPWTYPKLQYKPMEDVTPVSNGVYFSHGFGVGPAVPDSVKNIKDFLVWAKANPTKANYGSPGAGSMPHLVGALLEKASGVDLKHIGYRGSAPGLQDLLGGQISAMSSPIGDYLQYLASGKLRLLAVTGTKRNPFAPNVATYSEQGFPELTMREWYGFFMPAKTKPEIVAKAHAALKSVLSTKEIADYFAPSGIEPAPSASPEEFARLLKADTELWGPYVKRVGFTAES